MKSLEAFKAIFVSDSEAQKIGLKLRAIVVNCFPEAEEAIIGGARVKLALYSRNGTNNVLCGIQQAINDTCMLYVHYVDNINHERLKFSGKGKYAKRIKFKSVNEVIENDVKSLLQRVNKSAPF
ncbi:hypothetical protein [uncultured Psychroserpens sp.]|uniref:hypothetical protein n=1 Tax=uncultured Psychroserpens sp. TaxID=255436 RepID=UPI002634431B|nr:hypothetical protein [uncultured Psychroserpens sp.]